MLNELWFGNFMGIIGSLVGIMSLVLYLISLRKPIIGTYIKGWSLINIKDIVINNFEITIDKKIVEKLNKTSFYVWNKGSKTLRRDDIAKKDQLRIKWNDEIVIYQTMIGKQNNESSTVTIEPYLDEKFVLIGFDFLNKNDGFRIDLYHNSKTVNFDITGTVIGSKKSISKYHNKENIIVRKIFKIINSKLISYIIILPIGLAFLIFSLIVSDELIIKLNEFNDPRQLCILLVVFSILYLSMFLSRIFSPSKQYPENLEE